MSVGKTVVNAAEKGTEAALLNSSQKALGFIATNGGRLSRRMSATSRDVAKWVAKNPNSSQGIGIGAGTIGGLFVLNKMFD